MASGLYRGFPNPQTPRNLDALPIWKSAIQSRFHREKSAAQVDSHGVEIGGNHACANFPLLPVFICLIQEQEKVALEAQPKFGHATRRGSAHGQLTERTQ